MAFTSSRPCRVLCGQCLHGPLSPEINAASAFSIALLSSNESAINALSSYPAISTRIAVTASFDSFDIKIVVASTCHFAYHHLQSHSDIPKLLSIEFYGTFAPEGSCLFRAALSGRILLRVNISNSLSRNVASAGTSQRDTEIDMKVTWFWLCTSHFFWANHA